VVGTFIGPSPVRKKRGRAEDKRSRSVDNTRSSQKDQGTRNARERLAYDAIDLSNNENQAVKRGRKKNTS